MLSFENHLVIRGKIKDDTPVGTILTSTAIFGPCSINEGEGFLGSDSESKVTGTGTLIHEFPSSFLPVTLIIAFLGAVLIIQRTKEN